MLKSYRHNDFAFVGLIVLVFALLQLTVIFSQYAYEQDDTYAYEKCAEQQLNYAKPPAVPNSESPEIIESQKSSPSDRSSNEPENEKYTEPNWCDLAAQQSMANSTRWAMYAAWVAAVFTVIGIALIFGTLYFTARTLDEARDTTKAAKDTIVATEKAAKRQLRAYVSVEKSHLEVKDDNTFEVVITMLNSGQTPAKSVRTWFSIHPRILPTGEFEGFPETEFTSHGLILGRDVRYHLTRQVPILKELHSTEQFVAGLTERKFGAFAWGKVKYLDIFGDEWETEFRLVTGHRRKDGRWPMTPCAEGNHAT